jgi:hypothetical protein
MQKSVFPRASPFFSGGEEVSATQSDCALFFPGFEIRFDKPGILRLECAAFRNAGVATSGSPIALTQQRNTDENLFRQATRGHA